MFDIEVSGAAGFVYAVSNISISGWRNMKQAKQTIYQMFMLFSLFGFFFLPFAVIKGSFLWNAILGAITCVCFFECKLAAGEDQESDRPSKRRVIKGERKPNVCSRDKYCRFRSQQQQQNNSSGLRSCRRVG